MKRFCPPLGLFVACHGTWQSTGLVILRWKERHAWCKMDSVQTGAIKMRLDELSVEFFFLWYVVPLCLWGGVGPFILIRILVTWNVGSGRTVLFWRGGQLVLLLVRVKCRGHESSLFFDFSFPFIFFAHWPHSSPWFSGIHKFCIQWAKGQLAWCKSWGSVGWLC